MNEDRRHAVEIVDHLLHQVPLSCMMEEVVSTWDDEGDLDYLDYLPWIVEGMSELDTKKIAKRIYHILNK